MELVFRHGASRRKNRFGRDNPVFTFGHEEQTVTSSKNSINGSYDHHLELHILRLLRGSREPYEPCQRKWETDFFCPVLEP